MVGSTILLSTKAYSALLTNGTSIVLATLRPDLPFLFTDQLLHLDLTGFGLNLIQLSFTIFGTHDLWLTNSH